MQPDNGLGARVGLHGALEEGVIPFLDVVRVEGADEMSFHSRGVWKGEVLCLTAAYDSNKITNTFTVGMYSSYAVDNCADEKLRFVKN